MYIEHSVYVDLYGDGIDAARQLGAQVWQEMQIRRLKPRQAIDRRTSAEIIRDLRMQYGSASGVAEALNPGMSKGSHEYKASLRQVERQLRGDRGIGPAYRERYVQIAPPTGFAGRELAELVPPSSGVLTLQYAGTVEISRDKRMRSLPLKEYDDPQAWRGILSDPLGYYLDHWGGGVPFGGEGEFTITFDSDAESEDAGDE